MKMDVSKGNTMNKNRTCSQCKKFVIKKKQIEL